jgi:hypothetical protein
MEPALVMEERRPPPVEVSWAAAKLAAATMRTEVNFMVMVWWVCGGEVFV